jgi:hypothetical protein
MKLMGRGTTVMPCALLLIACCGSAPAPATGGKRPLLLPMRVGTDLPSLLLLLGVPTEAV